MVGPLELFYDLAVVVLIAQDAHHLAGHLTWGGLGEFVVLFTLIWIAWANGSLYHELHGHEDARSRSTFLLQILLLTAMGAFIWRGRRTGRAFAVAAAALFAVLAGLWPLAFAQRVAGNTAGRAPRRYRHRTPPPAPSCWPAPPCCTAGARIPAWGLIDVAYLAGFATVLSPPLRRRRPP